jgi:CcmD family protein
METESKLYIVIIVLAVIMAGLFVYLFTIDRKIGKLEKENKIDPNAKDQ